MRLAEALRGLKRRPASSLTAIAILGIGIAANTVLYSITDSVLLRPLPFREPERLAMAWEQHPMLGRQAVATPDFRDWQVRNHSFSELAAYTIEREHVPLWTGTGQPEPLKAALVTGNLLPLLGIAPVAGALFGAGDERMGDDAVVLLSHGLWMRRFGGAASAVGGTMVLDGTPFRIAGVLPAGHALPVWADIWMPLSRIGPERPMARANHNLEVIGRLRPGVTVERADEEIRAIAAQLSQEHPLTNGPTAAHVISLRQNYVAQLEKALLLLEGGAVLVLLICCANIAIFALVRAAERRNEMRLRAALGASPGRLFADAMTESLAVALCGGAAGVALAAASLDVLEGRIRELLPFAWKLELDWRVLVFSLACCVMTGVIFGLLPAMEMMRQARFCGASRGIVERRGRGGPLVVAVQTALAVVVLVCAGLLAKSFREILRVDPGFAAAQLLSMRVSLPPDRYSDADAVKRFEQRLFARVRELPEVTGVAATSQTPLARGGGRFWIAGRPDPPPNQFPVAQFRAVSAGFFDVAGVRLLSGRRPHDEGEPQPVLWVNRAFERRYFGSEEATGHSVLQGLFRPVRTQVPIAGVVSDIRDLGLDQEPEPTIYSIEASGRMTLMVRFTGSPAALEPEIRAAVSALDADVWAARGQSVDAVFAGALRDRELALELLGVFSLIACALAGLGIHAVVAHAVADGRREIGLRLAVGAERGEVVAMFLRRQLRAVSFGVAAGVPLAAGSAHLLRRTLFGVTTVDPATYVLVAAAIFSIAAAAAYLPARHASRIDPMVALRNE